MTSQTIQFIDNPAIKGDFTIIEIDSQAALKSWQQSVYSYEWLKSDGSIKSAEELSQIERTKRENAEDAIKKGQPITKPTLGMGVMDNIEIGSGRADLLTLIDQGHTSIPVHVPKSHLEEFEAFLAHKKVAETGNVLFIILIAVALLAALSFAITQSSQSGGSGTINRERASLIASEILSTSNIIAETVTKLRLSGCTENQISFDTPKLTGYSNASAPGDNSCNVFHINGGGLNYQPLNPEAANGAFSTWYFTSDFEIQDIGTTDGSDDSNELLIYTARINETTCAELNRLTLASSDIPTLTIPFVPSQFTGAYSYRMTLSDANIDGQRAACVFDTASNSYNFYRVLLAR